MLKFVVFDLDGTLLNTLPDIAGAMNRVLFRFGLPQHPEESYKHFTGNGARVLTQRALAGQEEMLEHVYTAYLVEYARNNQVDTQPYEGIPAVLGELEQEGVQMIVYSNKDDPDAREVVAHYFPGIRFAAVRGSLPGVPLKPSPEALLTLLGDLDLKPGEGLYVGDTVMDIQCAKAAGIRAVAALWGFQTEEELRAQQPDEVLESPLQLTALVRKQAG